jgi:hypothetical protein
VKALAWILTAATILVGADVFVMSSDKSGTDVIKTEEAPIPTYGGNGAPPPPPDAY